MDHFFLLFMFRVCHAFLSVHCSLVVTCWENGCPLDSLVCGVLLCFCRFPMWCPGSGVVLDCIDSGSLPPYLLPMRKLHFQKKINKVTSCGIRKQGKRAINFRGT